MKLVTGEEIIGKYIHKTEDAAYLEDPLVVKYRYGMAGPPTVTLARFSVFATEKHTEIKSSSIVAELEPVPLLIEYYVNMVEYLDMIYSKSMIEDLEIGIKSLKDSMKKFSGSKTEQPVTDEKISLEEIFAEIENPVKGTVH